MWQERADYGHFFYRIPNGESAADAYDRVSGFNESLWRQFGEDGFASVCVLVTHGLMTRVFLMKWYHFSVEYFEDLRNVNHCEFIMMKREENGKYQLRNHLRTWSELKNERALLEGKNSEKDRNADDSATAPFRKKWGGCPNGCEHGKFKLANRRKRENTMDAMQSSESSVKETEKTEKTDRVDNSLAGRRPATRRWLTSSEDEDDPRCRIGSPKIGIEKSLDEFVSSPDSTPSYITVEDRLRNLLASPNRLALLRAGGRDFGGSCSGAASQIGSESDMSEEERNKSAQVNQSRWNANSGMGSGAKADPLGDDASEEGDIEDLEAKEAEDKSLRGSVY
jgi:hypothetical protein